MQGTLPGEERNVSAQLPSQHIQCSSPFFPGLGCLWVALGVAKQGFAVGFGQPSVRPALQKTPHMLKALDFLRKAEAGSQDERKAGRSLGGASGDALVRKEQ